MMMPWNRDEEFVGLTPGLLPLAGEAEVRRIRRGEWKGEIAPQFTPPRGVEPALAGTLVDSKVHPRDLGAMMMDLVVRGWVVLEPHGDDWLLRAPEQPPADDDRNAAEVLLATALVGPGDGQLLSHAKRSLADPLRQISGWLYDETYRRGWYRRPLRGNPFGQLLGRVPRTATGTALRVQTLGFERYLATAEVPQIRVEEAAALFTRYLPYAMVFGLSTRWSAVMGEVLRKAQLEDAALVAADALSDPAMWLLVDALADPEVIGGLTDALLGADGLFGGLGDVLGDAVGGLGDLVGDIDLGDLFD